MYTGQVTVVSSGVRSRVSTYTCFLRTCVCVRTSPVRFSPVNEDIRNISAGAVPSGHGRAQRSRPSSFNASVGHSLGSEEDEKAGIIK